MAGKGGRAERGAEGWKAKAFYWPGLSRVLAREGTHLSADTMAPAGPRSNGGASAHGCVRREPARPFPALTGCCGFSGSLPASPLCSWLLEPSRPWPWLLLLPLECLADAQLPRRSSFEAAPSVLSKESRPRCRTIPASRQRLLRGDTLPGKKRRLKRDGCPCN